MVASKNTTTSENVVANLQQRIRTLERGATRSELHVESTGSATLDSLFPVHGIRHGSLVEWIGEQEGSGAGTLALLTAWHICKQAGRLIVVDAERHVSAQCLASLGCDLSRVVFVRPQSQQEVMWACEESLRCSGGQVLWAQIESLSDTSFRRLQLACESSGRIGFLVRPKSALRQPAWADARLLVGPRVTGTESPGFRVRTVYCRGETTGKEIEIVIDRRDGTIHESSKSSNPVPVVS